MLPLCVCVGGGGDGPLLILQYLVSLLVFNHLFEEETLDTLLNCLFTIAWLCLALIGHRVGLQCMVVKCLGHTYLLFNNRYCFL